MRAGLPAVVMMIAPRVCNPPGRRGAIHHESDLHARRRKSWLTLQPEGIRSSHPRMQGTRRHPPEHPSSAAHRHRPSSHLRGDEGARDGPAARACHPAPLIAAPRTVANDIEYRARSGVRRALGKAACLPGSPPARRSGETKSGRMSTADHHQCQRAAAESRDGQVRSFETRDETGHSRHPRNA